MGKYFHSKSSWFPLDLKVLPYFLNKKIFHSFRTGNFREGFYENFPITDLGNNILNFLTFSGNKNKYQGNIYQKIPSLIRESFFYILLLCTKKYGSPNCQFFESRSPLFQGAKREIFSPVILVYQIVDQISFLIIGQIIFTASGTSKIEVLSSLSSLQLNRTD